MRKGKILNTEKRGSLILDIWENPQDPKLIYSFHDENSGYGRCIRLTPDEAEEMLHLISDFVLETHVYTYSQVLRAVKKAAEDGTRGYTDVLPEDYI